MPNIALITNMPAPYREEVYEKIANRIDGEFTLIYCAEREPDREWKFSFGKYAKIFLRETSSSHVHNNKNVLKYLKDLNPDIVITTGFYPTMLYSFFWCLINRKKHIVFTDGTLKSEQGLSFVHKLVRKFVFKFTHAFIGTSNGCKALYLSYGIKAENIFRSYLSVNNERFIPAKVEDKPFDLMFSGQFIDRKMPFFFINVAIGLKEKMGRCKVLILGSGPLKEEILTKLKTADLDYQYPGFVDQVKLPEFYAQSKLFLFPTLLDPWGVVVNEAMASGVPVITCDNAGVAGDLVIDGHSGFVLPLDEQIWVDKCYELLTNDSLYNDYALSAREKVQSYSTTNAAQGILDAINSVNNG